MRRGGIPATHGPMTTLPGDGSWIRNVTNPIRRLGAWLATLVIGTIRRSATDDITGVGSQFAYNAFLATVPFLLLLVSVVGLVAQPDTFDRFLADNADNAIPVELRELLRSALRSATANTGQAAFFLVIGLLAALYVSSNVLGALVGGLDRARDVPHRPWVRGKLVALIFVVITSALVLATTLALVGGSRLVEALAEQIFGRDAPNWAGRFLYLIGTVSLLLFTAAVYHFGPNAPRRPLRTELPGALVAVALWVGVSRLFGLYVDNFGKLASVYGALASAAIYLIFLFLTCVSLLIGAEINEQVIEMRARARDGPPPPS